MYQPRPASTSTSRPLSGQERAANGHHRDPRRRPRRGRPSRRHHRRRHRRQPPRHLHRRPAAPAQRQGTSPAEHPDGRPTTARLNRKYAPTSRSERTVASRNSRSREPVWSPMGRGARHGLTPRGVINHWTYPRTGRIPALGSGSADPQLQGLASQLTARIGLPLTSQSNPWIRCEAGSEEVLLLVMRSRARCRRRRAD
jgi:hypothetical protein